jgi:hypothetical protein
LSLLALLALAWVSELRFPRSKRGALASELSILRQNLATGQRALDEGDFESAADALNAAQVNLARSPNLLSSPETRELVQLQRQAALLNDLLTDSLEDILRLLDGLPDRVAQSAFVRRYQGKSVVFYARVRRDAAGQYDMDYRIMVGGREAQLQLGTLKLLQGLPLQERRQMLFGARLASARRERDGQWTVSLEPDSGVLITHKGAAAACCFQPPDAELLQETLRQQAEWLTP